MIFWAFLPLAILIFLMLKPKPLASWQALPLSALVAYGVVWGIFRFSWQAIHGAVIRGLITAWTPILIVAGAILLFKTMEATGSLAILERWLKGISTNQVALLMIVGRAFPFLIEGASGFGTPVALAAPMLVGLGFAPVPSALLLLVMNTTPVSFGAVGTPTWFGFSQIGLITQEILEVGIYSVWIHTVSSFVIPLLGLRFLLPWSTIRKNLGFIFLSIFSTQIPYVVSAYLSYEFPALLGGLVGLLVSVWAAKKNLGLEPASNLGVEQRAQNSEVLEKTSTPILTTNDRQGRSSSSELWKGFLPLVLTVSILVITRIPALGIRQLLTLTSPQLGISLGFLGNLAISPSLVVSLQSILGTQISATHQLLYVPSLIPFFLVVGICFYLFRVSSEQQQKVWATTYKQMKKPALALFGALVFVELLSINDGIALGIESANPSAMVLLGTSLAQWAGPVWPGMASFLGALGSFFSGSNTVSNLTFGGIQYSIAQVAGYNPLVLLALQSVGGAMGHMVALNSIVAVCTVLGLGNQEGYMLKRVFPVLLVYGIITGIIGMVIA
jgi:lactate permease